MSVQDTELRALVHPDKVHRRVYADPAIFELEMERIFGRTWIYVAHESELKQPGDFVRSTIGRHDVLVARHADGEIYVLHNRCAHRGARLCSAGRGHASSFTCPYHGWSFRTDGSLQGLAHRASYPEDFRFDDPQHHLFRAPRVASYQGFVFASLAESGPSLKEHLGPMTEAFDNLIDRAPDGEVELSQHCFRLEYRANWKMHHENATDGFHPSFVHESSIAAARETPPGDSEFDGGSTREQLRSNSRTVRDWEELLKVALPRGHSYGMGFYTGGSLGPQAVDPARARYRAALEARHGAERTAAILGLDRFNNMVFPTIALNAQYQQMRVVRPISVDRTMVICYCFRLKGAPDEIFHRAVRYLTNLGSPASLIYTDDTAIFARCQSGLAESGSEWLDFSRGYGRDQEGEDGSLFAGPTEVTQRGQLTAWIDLMTAASS